MSGVCKCGSYRRQLVSEDEASYDWECLECGAYWSQTPPTPRDVPVDVLELVPDDDYPRYE